MYLISPVYIKLTVLRSQHCGLRDLCYLYLESWLPHLFVWFSKPSIAPAPCFTMDLVLLTPGRACAWWTHCAGPSHGGGGGGSVASTVLALQVGALRRPQRQVLLGSSLREGVGLPFVTTIS